MKQIHSTSDLIFLACSEPESGEQDVYHRLIMCDPDLSRKYRALRKIRNFLLSIEVKPSERVINNILSFSRAWMVEKTSSGKTFGLLLN